MFFQGDTQVADTEIIRRLDLFYRHQRINHEIRAVLVLLTSDGDYGGWLESFNHLHNCKVISVFEVDKISYEILAVPSIKKKWHELLDNYENYIYNVWYEFPFPPPGFGGMSLSLFQLTMCPF